MLTVGTTDQTRMFHPFGFAIVVHEEWQDFRFMFDSIKKAINNEYNPTTLIADNAPAITNGFTASFD